MIKSDTKVETVFKVLEYFHSVVKNQSFSEAAAECGVSQSAISQQIKTLEEELGVKLINREKRKFSLTPSGEYYFTKTQVLLADYQKIVSGTVKLKDDDDFILRIGFSKHYGGYEVYKAVAGFSEKYPKIRTSVVSGNHEDLYEALKAETVDIIFNDQRRAFSNDYVNFSLADSLCFIEIASRNPIASKSMVTSDALKDIPCILIASPEQVENEKLYYSDIMGFRGEYLFASNLEEARLFIIQGKGFMPIEGGNSMNPYSQNIVRIPYCKNESQVKRHYCAFWKADNSGFYIEEFADILKSEFEGQ